MGEALKLVERHARVALLRKRLPGPMPVRRILRRCKRLRGSRLWGRPRAFIRARKGSRASSAAAPAMAGGGPSPHRQRHRAAPRLRSRPFHSTAPRASFPSSERGGLRVAPDPPLRARSDSARRLLESAARNEGRSGPSITRPRGPFRAPKTAPRPQRWRARKSSISPFPPVPALGAAEAGAKLSGPKGWAGEARGHRTGAAHRRREARDRSPEEKGKERQEPGAQGLHAPGDPHSTSCSSRTTTASTPSSKVRSTPSRRC